VCAERDTVNNDGVDVGAGPVGGDTGNGDDNDSTGVFNSKDGDFGDNGDRDDAPVVSARVKRTLSLYAAISVAFDIYDTNIHINANCAKGMVPLDDYKREYRKYIATKIRWSAFGKGVT
jgi:hypothetical protein